MCIHAYSLYHPIKWSTTMQTLPMKMYGSLKMLITVALMQLLLIKHATIDIAKMISMKETN
jgi:hypothetical protein